MTNELRYKLKKSEQDNIALNSTIARLETQLTRLKSEAQEAERVEEELKLDKRKIQREVCSEFYFLPIFSYPIASISYEKL